MNTDFITIICVTCGIVSVTCCLMLPIYLAKMLYKLEQIVHCLDNIEDNTEHKQYDNEN